MHKRGLCRHALSVHPSRSHILSKRISIASKFSIGLAAEKACQRKSPSQQSFMTRYRCSRFQCRNDSIGHFGQDLLSQSQDFLSFRAYSAGALLCPQYVAIHLEQWPFSRQSRGQSSEGPGLPRLHRAKCGYVFLLVASSRAILVGYTLQGLHGV